MQVLMILLTILKVIGIILLSIVGIILLLILIILFVPIRYEGEFKYDDELTLKAKVSWFLKLFSVKWEYVNNEMHIKIRVIKLLKDKNKDKKIDKKTDNEADLEEAPEEVIIEEEQVDKTPPDNKDDDKILPKPVAQYRQTEEMPVEIKKEIQRNEKKVEDGEVEVQPSTKFKAKKKKEKKKEKTKEPSILEKLKAVYQHKDREAVFRSSKITLIKLFKHIRPRKFDISLIVGFEDPSNTGYVLALNGILKPFIDKDNHLHIQGEFNNEVFEGEGYLKGRIYIYYITYIAAKLLVDKKVRNYVSFIMRTFKK